MLEEADSLDDVKAIRDKAMAVQRYVESARLGLKLQNIAAELRLRAERKAGVFLAQLHLRGGDRRSKGHAAPLKVNLDDLGLTRDQSKRWQRVAAVPEHSFSRFIEEAKSSGSEISSAGLLRMARSVDSSAALRANRSGHSAPRSNKDSPNSMSTRTSAADPARNSTGDCLGNHVTDDIVELAAHIQTLRGTLILWERQVPATVSLAG
jgi:hypothetical protein